VHNVLFKELLLYMFGSDKKVAPDESSILS